jgi:hypothetical protein
MARREQEFKLQSLNRDLAGQKNLTHRANWEAKSDKLVQNQLIRSKMTDMRKRE